MPYTAFDRFVAWCRFRAALPHIRPSSRICDIGCGLEAGFLQYARGRVSFGVGVDYNVRHHDGDMRVILGDITRGLPLRSRQFDHAVMLAVLEHLSQPALVLHEAFRILVPGGSLIITWPSAPVDPVLAILRKARIVSSEMESQKHVNRIPLDRLQAILGDIGFVGLAHRYFELGLNNLLVGHRPC